MLLFCLHELFIQYFNKLYSQQYQGFERNQTHFYMQKQFEFIECFYMKTIFDL